MLKDLNTLEEILEFFASLDDSTGGKVTKARMYGAAYREQEQNEKERAVEKVLGESRGRRIQTVTLVSDTIAIVETIERWSGKESTYYHVVVNGKKINEVAEKFDFALILALAHKYGEGGSAPRAMHNILRMDVRKTLKEFMRENISTYPKTMNAAFALYGKNYFKDVIVGDNFDYVDVTEDQIQAVDVNYAFVETLEFLDAKMVPSLREITDEFRTVNGSWSKNVRLVSPDFTVEALVFSATLKKTTSLWIDLNEVKIVEE